jgi:predicted O-methyltransferase YrrM
MLSWDDVWPEVDATEGWLTEPEAQRLFDLARSGPAPMLAVELGSYKGRSTVAIARGLEGREGTRLLCVDLWAGAVPGPDLMVEHFARMKALGLSRIERHHCDTAAAAHWNAPDSVGLLFIDADHSYEAVRRDMEAWSPCVRSGGYVAFHDQWAPGPSRVIAELPGWYAPCGITDSLAVFRKG